MVNRKPNISFEFSPPRGHNKACNLWQTIDELRLLDPEFMSVTYGAGGSQRTGTDYTLKAIKARFGLPVAAHLTCVGQSRHEINNLARQWWNNGIRHIVALRGDNPVNRKTHIPHPDGYENAAALVAGLRDIAAFDISVAAYPETHPDSPSMQADIDNLRRKLDNGANRALTQYFFNIDDFLHFRDKAAQAGIWQPIVPGILPVQNIQTLEAFSKRCGAQIPDWLHHRFKSLQPGSPIHHDTAVATAAGLCHRLIREGVNDFHFYTLNSAPLCRDICAALGIKNILNAPEPYFKVA